MNIYNAYLVFDHTEVSNGKNYHYLRFIFLPNDWKTTLLVNFLELLSGVTLQGYFLDIPVTFPSTIASGTNVYKIDGGSWSAPTDLYLTVAFGHPSAPSVSPDVTDLFLGSDTYAVYGEIPPASSLQSEMPSDISPLTHAPNNPTYPNFHIPSGSFGAWSASIAWFSGGMNRSDLTYWNLAYSGCTIPTGHILENTDDFIFDELSGEYQIYFEAPSAAGFRRDSCHEDEVIGPYTIDTDSGVLLGKTFKPISTDPALYFSDGLLGITAGDDVAGIVETLMTALGMAGIMFVPSVQNLPGSNLFEALTLGARDIDGRGFAADGVYPFAGISDPHLGESV